MFPATDGGSDAPVDPFMPPLPLPPAVDAPEPVAAPEPVRDHFAPWLHMGREIVSGLPWLSAQARDQVLGRANDAFDAMAAAQRAR